MLRISVEIYIFSNFFSVFLVYSDNRFKLKIKKKYFTDVLIERNSYVLISI